MRLLLLFVLEALTFLFATVNIRACAKNRVALTLGTDLLIAANGFVLVKLVVHATTPLEMLAYVAGAMCGSYTGMRLTRAWQ